MTQLTGRQKFILTVAAWIGAACGLTVGVIFPLYLRLQNFPSVYLDTLYRLQGLEANIAKFHETESEYEAITARIPLITSQFLSSRDAVTFIESLEALAKDLNLYKEIQLVSEPDPSDKILDSFVFQITLVGSFENVMKYLAQMENFSYAVDVERTQIVPAKSSQTYGSQVGSGEVFRASAGDIAASITLRVHAVP